MDGKLDLVGGEAEAQPSRLTHWQRFVELAGESVEVEGEGHSVGGRVGDEQGDLSTVVDLGHDRKWRGAIGIPKEAARNVSERSSNRVALWVFGGGGMGRVESFLGGGERLWYLDNRYDVAG